MNSDQVLHPEANVDDQIGAPCLFLRYIVNSGKTLDFYLFPGRVRPARTSFTKVPLNYRNKTLFSISFVRCRFQHVGPIILTSSTF